MLIAPNCLGCIGFLCVRYMYQRRSILSRAASKGEGTYLHTMVSVWLVVCLLACLLVDSLQIFFPISEILSEQL